MKWFILRRDLESGKIVPMAESELEPRPADARPAAGDPFRPWYEEKDHVHLDEFGFGDVESVHVLAPDLAAAVTMYDAVEEAYYEAVRLERERKEDAEERRQWELDAAFDNSRFNV